MSNICIHKRPNGERCKARVMLNDKYCFFHSPDKKEERLEAVTRGGEAKRIIVTPDPEKSALMVKSLKTSKHLGKYVDLLINSVLGGEISLAQAQTLGMLIKLRCEITSDIEMNEEIKKLKDFAKEQKRRSKLGNTNLP